MSKLLLLGLIFFMSLTGRTQFPAYFSYNVENGGPANEVYCITQDKQGYIWIGCDAGLYRFNGVRFEHFSSPELTSRSVSGVCQSSSGRIYAYNFNGQLLYVENGELLIVKKWSNLINQISPGKNGKIWISSEKGLKCLDERTLTWRSISDLDGDGIDDRDHFANSVRVNANGEVFFFYNGRLIRRTDKKTVVYPIRTDNPMNIALLTNNSGFPWVFSLFGGTNFIYSKGRYIQFRNKELENLLRGRKITCTSEIGNEIWITTHTGVIRYNKLHKTAQLLYPKVAFSGCMKDREGNYWFTTLHDGILRMPNLDFLVWNEQTGALSLDKFTHLTPYRNKMVFAKSDGEIGELNLDGSGFNLLSSTFLSDFGAVYFDQKENSVIFNKISSIFRLQAGKISMVNSETRPVKSFMRIQDEYIMASSQGAYVYSNPKEGFTQKYKITGDWSRILMTFPGTDDIFLSGNHGLYRMRKIQGKWKIIKHFFHDEQISSITHDDKYIYALSFKGVIYRVKLSGHYERFDQIPENVRAVQLVAHDHKLYIATNNGLLIINKNNGHRIIINRFHGLSSNNISQICILGNYCWLATGRGLHRIPINLLQQSFSRGNIILRDILVNGKQVSTNVLHKLHYNDQFSISVDGLYYKSNGNFNFAYRFVGDKEGWTPLPGNSEVLSIPRLPLGNITLQLKMIDHENRDSENILQFKLYVSPPYYQRWWFYLLITLSMLGLSLLVFKIRIQQLRRKQDQRLRQLRLENELRLTQQNALKAQMNPHFLFNVLNSIKGYIYENDKKNAARYLSDFSSLVRKVLELSSLPTVSLEEEIEALKLYIDLEAMLLQRDFEYSIITDENIDLSAVHVPSLLLQPYVENAFKHGLRHKKGPKRLIIRIQMNYSDGLLIIEITDNGIGRNAAELLNTQNRGEHQSFASSAMEKRIQLLNFEKKDVVGVEIRDNFEIRESAGTTVIIQIHV